MFYKHFQFLIILLFLCGCTAVGEKVTSFMGGEDNAAPPTPLEDIVQRVEVKRLWEKNTGAGTDEQYLKLVPVYLQGKLFVADSTGEVIAIDAATGKVVWDRDTDVPITGGPGAGEMMVMVGTGKAEVITMSADTGEIIWKTRVTSEVLAAPQISGNIIVVRTIDGKIVGLNKEDGNRLWVYDRAVPALTLRGTSAPVIAQGLVIAGFDEGRLAAIELQTGKLVWETRIALGSGRSELDRMVDIDSEPVVMDDVIYVATFQGRIAALSLDSGRILWTRDIASYAGVCADSTAVYITDDNSEIWALDRFTGVSIWKQDKLNSRAVTAPENIGNMVAVGDLEGYVHWLDKLTGEIVARKQVSDEKIIAPPLSVDNVLYSYTSDGTLAAYTSDPLSASVVSAKPEEKPELQNADTSPPVEQIETTESESMQSASEESEVEEQPETTETTEEEEKGFFGKLLDSMFESSEERY